MANININEVSQNYTYNIGNSSFATVALPITSCWGPGFIDDGSNSLENELSDEVLESVVWSKFPATQAGLESFISTYRGPVSNYRLVNDYSYQMAMTLLTSGYDILACRLASGSQAQGEFRFSSKIENESGELVDQYTYDTTPYKLVVKAKYPGTF